jgi:hypothetical protein
MYAASHVCSASSTQVQIQEAIMNCNVGGIDRTVRIVAGIALLLVGLLVPMETVWQAVVLIIAAVALVTAFVRFCPANTMLGINTCGEGEKKKKT